MFLIQIYIYETYEDLVRACDDETASSKITDGCMAFVLETQFIYVQMPGESCEWLPWVRSDGV